MLILSDFAGFTHCGRLKVLVSSRSYLPQQAPTTQNILEFLRFATILFAIFLYLNKKISVYNNKYIIVLPTITFIFITDVT